jgi:hypothetical protein
VKRGAVPILASVLFERKLSASHPRCFTWRKNVRVNLKRKAAHFPVFLDAELTIVCLVLERDNNNDTAFTNLNRQNQNLTDSSFIPENQTVMKAIYSVRQHVCTG